MSKIFKIAIIGGGWFGCHVGNEIKKTFKKKLNSQFLMKKRYF